MSKRAPHTSLSQSDIAIQIERLVQAIEDTNIPEFRITRLRPGQVRVQTTRLSAYFDHIQQMVGLFEGRHPYDYSEHLQVFWQAAQDIGLELSPVGLTCFHEVEVRYLSTDETLNILTDRIRRLTGAKRYQRGKVDRRYQAKEKQAKITEYIDRVLNRYSRTVVVRIDLHYLSVVHARLRVEEVFADQARLAREIERNSIFDHLTGYICSVEQGEERGYHIHAAFFFNGADVRSDFAKARQIGQLWERITRGQGYYHSCNDDKDSYGDGLGIGVIRRDDMGIRPKVHYAMRYLGKDTQHLRLKPMGAKCLRKGTLRRLSV
ncbi:inovirus-type Gp2 protein [Pseudomonas sp. C32]|uniref:YagK/YfjJ domain-containing protein n=1 Tax=Pseudomonas sp. C32 TaxID=1529208 RepID=UPI0026130D3A|nr:inovirus-type Gp2 protein [Pseudomonas sp. C32]MDN4546363.1 inovirus-type Gp2 protein [Pseudomonas sp. C32]